MREKILHILPSLRRFSYALSGTQHDADDLLQSTVERLLDKGVPDGANLTKWAFRICRNLWIDEVRKRKIRRASDIDELHQAPAPFDGEKVALGKITLDQVNDAMKLLPETQRSTLSMVSLAGLSYAEIAEIMDVPIGTVMSRVARARSALTERFAETIIDPAPPHHGSNHELH